ncbi:MAG: hypothetical protein K6D94_07535 [Clostridiales bacterium]|nr:hypothetical protein [Clostridiales bacterium]
MSKSTGNLFADYLLYEYGGKTYDMRDIENTYSFIRFFDYPFYLPDKNNQLTIVTVSSPAFSHTRNGKIIRLDDKDWISESSLRYKKNIFTPGDLVEYDLYSNAYEFCSREDGVWCLYNTQESLSDFHICLKTHGYNITCKLNSNDEGIFKYSWQWQELNILNDF